MTDKKNLVQFLDALLRLLSPDRAQALGSVEAALAELRRAHNLRSIVPRQRRVS